MKRARSPTDEGKSFAFGPLDEDKTPATSKQKTGKEGLRLSEARLPAFGKVIS